MNSPAREIAENRPGPHTSSGRPSALRRGERALALRTARTVGALALLAVGGVHLEQYSVAHFAVIPTIGSLFLLNFISATTIGLVLLIPLRATAGQRRLMFESVAAVAGIGAAAGALIALLISEHTSLFGFMERGYRLEIVIALASEVIAVISLGAFLACASRRTRRSGATAAVPTDAIGAAVTRRTSE